MKRKWIPITYKSTGTGIYTYERWESGYKLSVTPHLFIGRDGFAYPVWTLTRDGQIVRFGHAKTVRRAMGLAMNALRIENGTKKHFRRSA